MRYERQNWDSIVARTEIVVSGVAETGASPTVAIRRDSDGLWLAGGGGSWVSGGPAPTNAMTHVGGDQPGVYQFAVAHGDLSDDAEGYELVISAAAAGSMPGPLYENVRIELEMGDHLPMGSTTSNTLGDWLRRTLGLRQRHQRTVYSTFDASDRPTSGIVLIYASGADLDSDTGPSYSLATGRYDFTATYDSQGRLTEYKSKEIS